MRTNTDVMDPRDQQELSQAFERAPVGQIPAPLNHGAMTQLEQNPVGAKRVDVRRNDAEVIAKIKTHAAMAGTDWFYRFPVKKKGGGQDFITGPSVKLANAVARLYGNCQVDVRVVDNGPTFMIYAKFIDIETGFALVRPFQQDKGASRMGGTGPEADARRLDIALQIGTSKATRNVICNALATFCDFAFEEAEKNLVGKIGKNMEAYRDRAVKWFAGRQIDLARVEAAVGRSAKDWLAPDLARIAAEVKAVEDGMATADETWPPPPAPEPKRGDFEKKAAEGDATAKTGDSAGAASEASQESDPPAEDGKPATEPEKPSANAWLPDVVGQDAITGAIITLITDKAASLADLDAIQSANAERVAKFTQANRAKITNAMDDRREDLGGK
jgi:hypothetical protein